MELRHDRDAHHVEHLDEAARALRLPLDVNRLRWHPFGVYSLPLGPRTEGGVTWSRRLHVWHPQARPVGEASPYGVHTHSGTARSHVLVGALHHHLYAFAHDNGAWRRAELGRPTGPARLVAHVQATTPAGTTHTLPADQPHSVTKAPGLAMSLFEQVTPGSGHPFTTWQRTDIKPERLDLSGPVDAATALRDAKRSVEVQLARAV